MNHMIKVNPKCKISIPFAIIELEHDSPYGVLKLSFKFEPEEGCLCYIEEVDSFIKKEMDNLYVQLENFQKHEPIYHEAFNHLYSKIVSMKDEISKLNFETSKAKFQYHIAGQKKYYKEYVSELDANIAEINEDNYEEYIIDPSILKQIYGKD